MLLFQWWSSSEPRFTLAEGAVLCVTPHPTPTSIGVAIEEGAVPQPYTVRAITVSCPNERWILSGLPNRVRRGDL